MWSYRWQEPYDIQTYTDSNFAGCRRTARSTSGGIIMRGGHHLKSWSATQRSVTLSSAEAELAACIKASLETIGILQLIDGYGIKLQGEIFVDSSAALSVVVRAGVGRDEEEDFMDEAYAAWLRAWRGFPDAPGEAYESWLRSRKEARAGGRRAADIPLRDLVRLPGAATTRSVGPPSVPHVGSARAETLPRTFAGHPVVGGLEYAAWRKDLALTYVLGRLAEGTRVIYGIGWKQWCW